MIKMNYLDVVLVATGRKPLLKTSNSEHGVSWTKGQIEMIAIGEQKQQIYLL